MYLCRWCAINGFSAKKKKKKLQFATIAGSTNYENSLTMGWLKPANHSVHVTHKLRLTRSILV